MGDSGCCGLQFDGGVDDSVGGRVEDTVPIVPVEDDAAFARGHIVVQALERRGGVEALDVDEVDGDLCHVWGVSGDASLDEVADACERDDGIRVHSLAGGCLLGEDRICDRCAGIDFADNLGEAVDIASGDLVLEPPGRISAKGDALVLPPVVEVVVRGFGGIQEACAHLEGVAEGHVNRCLDADEEVEVLVEDAVQRRAEPCGHEVRVWNQAAGPHISASCEDRGLQERHEHVASRECSGRIRIPPQ